MSGTVNGKTELAVLAVGQLDPIHLLQVDRVVAAEADGQARLLEAQPQQIVDVALHLLLEIADGGGRQFADAAAIESPAVVAVGERDDDGGRKFADSAAIKSPAVVTVVESDDDAAASKIQSVEANQRSEDRIAALADVFRAVFVRIATVMSKLDVAGRLAIVAKKHAAALALALADFRITRPAQRVDQIGKNLLALGDALLRHHGIGILGGNTWGGPRASKENDDGDMDGLYPHKTEPPFTLMTSPVMKLARSEATKRIGPAISSAVAARPRGMTVVAIFWPALDSSTALDMSVATQPGATAFTRILCRASSVARPLVRLMMPPLEAP